MKAKYIELTCDHCGHADFFLPGVADKVVREDGWIITRDGKHYCDKDCYSASNIKAD